MRLRERNNITLPFDRCAIGRVLVLVESFFLSIYRSSFNLFFRNIHIREVSSTTSILPFNQWVTPVQQLVLSAFGNRNTILNLKGGSLISPPRFASCLGNFNWQTSSHKPASMSNLQLSGNVTLVNLQLVTRAWPKKKKKKTCQSLTLNLSGRRTST